jgi:hypothetical protein
MKKSILYKLFGLGRIPKKLRPVLESEGIVVADEGIRGWFKTKHVKGPGKRFIHRTAGISGSLVITEKRIICFTFGKRQINIDFDNPNITKLFADIPEEKTLSIAFEGSDFRDDWSGIIEFLFKTEKARQFLDHMQSKGIQQGTPSDIARRR